MRAIVRFLAAAVYKAPVVVVVVTLVLAGVLGSFAGQVEIATGNEGFAPDNAEIEALERIGELFSGEQVTHFQVVVRQPGGDVISPEGIAAVTQVEEAIRRVAGDAILDTEEAPGVTSYLTPAFLGLAEGGGTDAAAVDAAYTAGLEMLDPATRDLLASRLVSADAEGAQASAGLVVATLKLPDGETMEAMDAQIELEESIAAELEALDSPLEIRPFSTTLLFGAIDSFTSEVGRLFAYAGVIIVVILLFVYWLRPRGSVTLAQSGRRTVADMLVTIATIMMSIGMMQGAGVLLERVGVIDAFSAPTQVVPILMIGLGVDYAIHLISRYREEVGEGATVDAAMETSIGTSGVALVLATVTTMIGFLTNIANPVPALADFGILAALGIFFSFLMMMTFVPALRVLLDRRAERRGSLPADAMASHGERLLPQLMGRTAVIAERLPVLAIGIALALAGFGWYGFSQLETRFDFTDFLPEDAPAVETLQVLRDDFGGGVGESTQVLVTAAPGTDLAEGRYWNLMLDASANLATTDAVVSFPTEQGPVAAAESPISMVQQALAGGPANIPPNVLGPLQEVGMGLDMRVRDDADMTAVYQAVAAEGADLGTVTHFEDDRLDAVLFTIQTSAGGTGVAQLRDDLDAAFASLENEGADVIATSDNIISDVVVKELTASQSWSLFLTLAAAGIVLVLYFLIQNRRPFLGVITMLPVVLVVMWTYGLMFAAGIPFGPVTATLAALAIGIGVPYTIHLARRFEEDRQEMESIEEAIRSTTTHTGGALAGSAFTTIAGFGILITSSLVPFKQMGQVTVFAIGLSLLAAILVLPSMLVLWERYHRRGSTTRRSIAQEGS